MNNLFLCDCSSCHDANVVDRQCKVYVWIDGVHDVTPTIMHNNNHRWTCANIHCHDSWSAMAHGLRCFPCLVLMKLPILFPSPSNMHRMQRDNSRRKCVRSFVLKNFRLCYSVSSFAVFFCFFFAIVGNWIFGFETKLFSSGRENNMLLALSTGNFRQNFLLINSLVTATWTVPRHRLSVTRMEDTFWRIHAKMERWSIRRLRQTHNTHRRYLNFRRFRCRCCVHVDYFSSFKFQLEWNGKTTEIDKWWRA